ncbi:MAG: NAD(P)H-hydrate dehydratase [Pseudomonadota bacterium]
MTELLTAAQMRAIEQAAIDSGEVTGLELMERAGRGVVEAILDWRPELAEKSHRAVVLCGPGNNGGDGFVVARLLHARGWEVEVFLYGCDPDDLSKLPPDAQTNARRWATLGPILPWNDEGLEDRLDDVVDDLVVDALFGAGLSRPIPSDMERTWHGFVPNVQTSETPRFVAVDLPSGLCSDSGANLEGALPANLTVTFHASKLGHVLSDPRPLTGGPIWCGQVRTVDIGLAHTPKSGVVRLVDRPRQLTKWAGHKYGHGHALVLAGGVGKGGAARLAARGALRVGAGLVTVGCPKTAVIENAARLDAIMLRPVEDTAALSEALSDTRLNALCLGPGLGIDRARALVPMACKGERAVVLDADALTAFADDPQELWALTHPKCVLTPHEGEFGRLFPDILKKLKAPAVRGPAYSKVDATREAAARAGCVVLFKGPDTVIADPSGRASVNAAVYERAAPWLATAGSGDVLAGMITGLLARGFAPMAAAETAAWLHVEAARRFGPGLIAEDIAEQLPGVFRDLGL